MQPPPPNDPAPASKGKFAGLDLDEHWIGQLIGQRYKIIDVLGSGGWSTVYKALDTKLDRVVALKLLQKSLSNERNRVRRFQREGKALSKIFHTNLVTLFDADCLAGGRPYMVVDYIDGISLSQLISTHGRIEPAMLLPILLQICDGLTAVHRAGIIHRDLKPSNIMLVTDPSGKVTVKILDFGLAKLVEVEQEISLTPAEETVGTPAYMSPEQCKRDQLDQRADVYSVGCMVFECLCGKPPFQSNNILGTVYKQVFETAPSIAEFTGEKLVSDEFEAVLQKMLAKEAAERYQSMEELKTDLLKLPDGGVQSNPPASGSGAEAKFDDLLSDTDPLIGNVFAEKYKIESKLGEGMGVVYKATDLFLHRPVVVKVLPYAAAVDRKGLLRFRQEGAVLSKLEHPNIVSVYEFGIDKNSPYLAMQFIYGTTIGALIDEKKQIDIKQAVDWLIQAAEALRYAHEQHVIHRDLKPANLIIEAATNTLKVLDFGIAKITSDAHADAPRMTTTGAVFGSPPYMSPEQARGQQLDGRSDIYSLGCVAFEMLTGQTPHKGADPMDIMVRKQVETIPLLTEVYPQGTFPEDLQKILDRMLAKERSERFDSMAEVIEALERLKSGQPVQLNELKERKAKKRANALRAATTILAVVVVSITAYFSVTGFTTYSQLRVPSGRLESIQPTSCIWEQYGYELNLLFPEQRLDATIRNFEQDRSYLRGLAQAVDINQLSRVSQRLCQEFDTIFPFPYSAVTIGDSCNLPKGEKLSPPEAINELDVLAGRTLTKIENMAVSNDVRGALYSIQALSKYTLCDFTGAENLFAKAVSHFQSKNASPEVQARALSGLGNALYFQQKYPEAILAYEKALAFWDQVRKTSRADKTPTLRISLPRIYGLTESRLADCYRVERNFTESRKHYGLACTYWKETAGAQSKPVALCWLYLAYLDSQQPPEKDEGNFFPNYEPAGYEYRRTSADVRGEFGKLKRAELLTRWAFAGTNYLGFLLEDIYQIRYQQFNPMTAPGEFIERLEARRISKTPEFVVNGAVVAKDMRPFNRDPNHNEDRLPGAVRVEP